MDSDELLKNVGNHGNTSSLAAKAANAARPNAGDPMKIATGSISTPTSKPKSPGSLPGETLVGSANESYEVPNAQPEQTPFPSMPYYGGAMPNPYFGFMDPAAMQMQMQAMSQMGKGMPPPMGMMAPTMMPPVMPMMPFPGMHPMMPAYQQAGGGKPSGKGNQDKEKKRRTDRKKKKEKEEANEVDESSIVRSKELQEVRNAGQGKCQLTLQDVMGQVVEFATDQHGSRFLQQGLESSTDPAEKAAVLQAIQPEIKRLAKDQYGNFVIQKLFEVVPDKRVIADELEGEVVSLAMDVHGCRVIQKALVLLPRDAQTKLALELQDTSGGGDKVAECIENMHGNHVIQKCIEQMPPDSVNFIIDSVSRKVDSMAEHMYGCRIIQRLLEHCAPHQLKEMLEKIMVSIKQKKMVAHPFGNYVVQHMLEHGRSEDKKRILAVVTASIFEFSTQKCSSNVVEKCFEIASIGEHAESLHEERRNLYNAVLNVPMPGAPYPIKQLTDDKFGNYIVQRMLEYSRDPERGTLFQQLSALAPLLENSSNGKHIHNALKDLGVVASDGQ